ncbi:MAG TPA: GGDEF domain-containing protein [Candidatus Saccharimonadales bacterium]|nr:GGDEF domain-containing protein [Candidatus Saccharimonadales bacterium]
MSIEPILALIVVAVVANLVVMGILVAAPTMGRGRSGGRLDPAFAEPGVGPARSMADAVVIGGEDEDRTGDGVPTRAYDRVVRIVTWIFLLATTTIVAVSGLWTENQGLILALLAMSGLFILVVHDLLPAGALGAAKFVVEGSVAITVATLLVALTGGVVSPFFFVYPLIVGGAALVVTPAITVGLAATAALGYLLAVLVGSPPAAAGSATTAIVGINLTAMILLAYVAMVIAREQRRSRDAAIRLSTIDPLTGLFNRGFFFAALEREIQRSARSGRGFCLLMMDLDELKTINDRMGHFHGDRVLRAVGDVVEAGGRRIDTAARYGGDEFVVLLPETDPTGAFVLAEKVRLGVQDMELQLPDPALRPSLSVGVVSYPDDGTTADELMISADGAMYASKRSGKNRVTGVNMPADQPRDSGVASAT